MTLTVSFKKLLTVLLEMLQLCEISGSHSFEYEDLHVSYNLLIGTYPTYLLKVWTLPNLKTEEQRQNFPQNF
jgi:hypothetical protein